MLPKSHSESGSAIVEFVAFAALILLPISILATDSSISWQSKSYAQSEATTLARAASLGRGSYDELVSAIGLNRPDFSARLRLTACCVEVEVVDGGANAIARQPR